MAAQHVLREIQTLLGSIYDLPMRHDVRDFLVSDSSACMRDATGVDEELLVARTGEELEIGLYVEAGVLARLEAANPLRRLDAHNLADYWTALEGVSHFAYLAFNADHDRAVSRLELETQAEVDKYVASLWLLRRQSPGRFPLELYELLFERASVDPRVAPHLCGLYRSASRHAARFCAMLQTKLRRRISAMSVDATADLRRFYRLNDARKLDRCLRPA